jgi:adenylate cyclase class 2
METELAIAFPQRWPRLLEGLGFLGGFRYEKYRTTFQLAGIDLDLDEAPIGVFLELEGQSRAIDRVARRLGYLPREYIRLTYWDLYAANCRRRRLIPTNMVFDK